MSALAHASDVMQRLEDIEHDLAARQPVFETAARNWFVAKRDREKERASLYLECDGTVSERTAHATKFAKLTGATEEADYEATKAVVNVLETRASILQSLLKAGRP